PTKHETPLLLDPARRAFIPPPHRHPHPVVAKPTPRPRRPPNRRPLQHLHRRTALLDHHPPQPHGPLPPERQRLEQEPPEIRIPGREIRRPLGQPEHALEPRNPLRRSRRPLHPSDPPPP